MFNLLALLLTLRYNYDANSCFELTEYSPLRKRIHTMLDNASLHFFKSEREFRHAHGRVLQETHFV